MYNIPKSKLIDAAYQKETGFSKVMISNRYGVFSGYAFVHPEEKYPSRFLGCEFAELRAYIATLKEMRKEALCKAKALSDFYKSMENTRTFNENSYYAIRLRKDIEKYRENAALCKKNIANIRNNIKNTSKNHEVLTNTMDNKK